MLAPGAEPHGCKGAYSEKYVRARDDPYFDGMRRGETEAINKGSGLDILRKVTRNDITRSASDVGNRGQKKISVKLSENDVYNDRHSPNSASKGIHELLGRSLSVRCSAASKLNSPPVGSPRPGLKVDLHDVDESSVQSSPKSSEANGEYHSPGGLTLPAYERSYTVTKKSRTVSDIPLPPSAASFYYGNSVQMEVLGSCQGIHRLNIFLKARRDYVSAGVPSKFLHAVIGPDYCDVGSVASTIMYAFYLNETLNDDELCTVPVINMKRSDVHSHAELRWLLDSCFVDESSLIFVDEIDLSYYELYGSLKLVLVNCSKLPANQEEDTPYSSVAAITIGKEASCCTLIADKFTLTSPEILVGQWFSRLLLAGILMDTGNLTNSQTTTKDKYMTTLLINGAGRFGCNGLYEILRYKMHDAADARPGEVSRKDIKRLSKSDAADPRVGEVLEKDIKKLSKSNVADPGVGEVLQRDAKKSSKPNAADPGVREVLLKDSKKLSKSYAADPGVGEVLQRDAKKSSKPNAADPGVREVLLKDSKKLSKSDAADPGVGEVSQKNTKKLSKSDEADHRAEEVLQKDIKKLSKSDSAEPRMEEVLRKDDIDLSKSDAADPRTGEVLRKDIKRWSKSELGAGKPGGTGSRMGNSNIGMSSVGISIGELLTHHSTSAENIRSFQQLEKLHILLIVSGYYDAEKSFKREILVSAESAELMKSLLHFIYSHANVLPLKALRQSGLAAEMRVFEIEKIVSRKTIEKLLEEFNERTK
ncbi:hypothetical protein H5410_007203 [Solanum commersonii]|uniref:DHHA2 domain-containing protein n=1 Tax=Solanum commersonii TaxID=4109 RepID=A0A9J6ABY6_SOLCO|nr:hypothetical protein H5410_007203 [Solanum commersonii]